jgi:hypothetical protein
MAECTYCKAETFLYESGIPVCLECADHRGNGKTPGNGREVRAILLTQNLREATARSSAATEIFKKITLEVPSGIPHADCVQRIHNASSEISSARDEMMKAHHRLNEFIETGTVPDDLKQTS